MPMVIALHRRDCAGLATMLQHVRYPVEKMACGDAMNLNEVNLFFYDKDIRRKDERD